MASVSLQKLGKSFSGPKGREVQAVNDISLEIHDGEFLVLVGPSGCGKSTTLRLIAGLENATQGSIFIDDTNVTNATPKDRDIAMVFQNYALFPHMSVRDNIGFGLKLRKYKKAEIQNRVAEVAGTLGLLECLDRKPQALSGGQRQRVALGRAIVRQPKVFLFDEPLSNLDAKMRLEMRAELIQLHRRLGATMIFVTHDQAEAMTMGDRIAVMHQGEVQQVDEPMTIYQRPANRFVAGFMGSPPMNFLTGRLETNGQSRVFTTSTTKQSVTELPWTFEIKDTQPDSTESSTSRDLVIGLRPEDLQLNPAGQTSRGNAQLVLVESLGAESYLHLNAYGHPLVARVPHPVAYRVDDRFEVDWDDARLHLFDYDSGRRLNR